MLCHPYYTPTFRTKALHFVTNGGQLKRLLLLYINGYYGFILVFFDYNWRRILLFSTRMTDPLLKLKRSVLLLMEGVMANTALSGYNWRRISSFSTPVHTHF